MAREQHVFRKSGHGVFPTTDAGAEYLEGLTNGQDIMVTLWTPRNPRRHRRFFAFANQVAKNRDYKSTDDLMDDFKYAHKMYRVRGLRDGRFQITLNSFAYDKMDDREFLDMERLFYDWVYREHGIDVDEVKREVSRELASYGAPRT